jgi:hypothetical protein
VCVAVGECDNPVKAGSCVIGGKCWAENEANGLPVPALRAGRVDDELDRWWRRALVFIEGQCWPRAPARTASRACAAGEVSMTTWSPANTAHVACDDGNACTGGDTCNGGACLGTAYTCDDEKACTDNVCDGAGGCGYPVKAGSCLIGGTCYADGEREGPTTCLVCDDAVPEAWSAPTTALSCDDGEVHASGTCAPALPARTSYECDDLSPARSTAVTGRAAACTPRPRASA